MLTTILSFFKYKESKLNMNKFLIVGLGNIGSEYANTRHNIGFRILNHFAEQNQVNFKNAKFGDIAELKIKEEPLFCLNQIPT